jgi:hypothetical protein
MKKNEKRSPLWVVISGLAGIVIFLVLLVILGYLASYFHNAFLLGIVTLLVNNLALIITAGIIFIVADVFLTFRFPFNIPGPLFSGLGSLLVVSLLFILMDFFSRSYGLGISAMFSGIQYILYPLVFLIVVLAGYARIFYPEKARAGIPGGADTDNPPGPPGKTWDDIGNEFRQALYDFFHRIREELNRK